MFLLPLITELELRGIEDPGVPNRERIVLQAVTAVNLAEFAVILGWEQQPGGGILPRSDAFCWLGERHVASGAWVVLMTGQGKDQTGKHTDGADVHWFYWGRDRTVFLPASFSAGLRPAAALIRLGGIKIKGPR